MSSQSISQYFSDDHDRLDSLFEQFQQLKVEDLQQAILVFKQFSEGLLQHIVWEEELLFPAFEEKTNMHNGGPTFVMRHEHQLIKEQLKVIGEQLDDGQATDQAEQTLLQILTSHNQKEEQILYPAIDRLCNDNDRAGLFSEIETTYCV